MTTKPLLALLSLAILLPGCDGTSTPATPTGPTAAPISSYILSGTISEITAAGPAPIEGAHVADTRNRSFVVTDDNGRYSIPVMPAMTIFVSVTRWGYATETKEIAMSGNTQLDIRLVRMASHILSGVVFEITAAGRVPIEGVDVYCDSCGSPDGHTSVHTDKNGSYSLAWAMNGVHPLFVTKAGYEIRDPTGALRDKEGRIVATVDGDTRFDIELVRQ